MTPEHVLNLADKAGRWYPMGGSPDALHGRKHLVAFARLIEAAERERIADLWAGCTTEAEGHGLVDVGASIRAGKLIDT